MKVKELLKHFDNAPKTIIRNDNDDNPYLYGGYPDELKREALSLEVKEWFYTGYALSIYVE